MDHFRLHSFLACVIYSLFPSRFIPFLHKEKVHFAKKLTLINLFANHLKHCGIFPVYWQNRDFLVRDVTIPNPTQNIWVLGFGLGPPTPFSGSVKLVVASDIMMPTLHLLYYVKLGKQNKSLHCNNRWERPKSKSQT